MVCGARALEPKAGLQLTSSRRGVVSLAAIWWTVDIVREGGMRRRPNLREAPRINPSQDTESPGVRWGILGTGTIARLFAADLGLVRGARLEAVASREFDRAEVFSRRHGVTRALASYASLLADPNVDVVYIATPHSTHSELAIAALHAGKAVLCEKPFTTSADEARDVVQAARRSGCFCMEAMWMRFAPAVRELQRQLSSGAIGEVRHVQASLGFAVPFDPTHRLFDRSLGGGAMLDLGVYAVSLCSALLGKPSQIEATSVSGSSGVDEEATLHLSYPGGATAIVETSLRRRLANDAIVHGSRGHRRLVEPLYFPPRLVEAAAADQQGRGWTAHDWLSRGTTWVRRAAAGIVPGVRGLGYEYQASEVMRCIAKGLKESPVMPLDESVQVMEILDAAQRAGSA